MVAGRLGVFYNVMVTLVVYGEVFTREVFPKVFFASVFYGSFRFF